MINGVSKSYKSQDISEIEKPKSKKVNLKLKKKIKEKSYLDKK
tara:strand:- start:148 stop:276 length:129 start_codon:yes stop_codon:yes gene_type:complete